jgi:hypothetical protein
MIPTRHRDDPGPRRRRYLVHLLCASSVEGEACRYIARIRPWTGRHSELDEVRERAFADDSELIAAINPLLPSGSDVRDVFDHIESPKGFYYLLWLSNDEAQRLGWHR